MDFQHATAANMVDTSLEGLNYNRSKTFNTWLHYFNHLRLNCTLNQALRTVGAVFPSMFSPVLKFFFYLSQVLYFLLFRYSTWLQNLPIFAPHLKKRKNRFEMNDAGTAQEMSQFNNLLQVLSYIFGTKVPTYPKPMTKKAMACT